MPHGPGESFGQSGDLELFASVSVPFDGVITLNITDEVRDLWAMVDASYPGQRKMASAVWVEALQSNTGSIRLGSKFANSTNSRGFELKPGERSPDFGPLVLTDWFVAGTANDKVSVFVIVKSTRNFQGR